MDDPVELVPDRTGKTSHWIEAHFPDWFARLRKTLRYRGLSAEDAEDIAQQSIVEFWHANSQSSDPPPWPILYGIARHKYADLWRRRYNTYHEIREVSLDSVEGRQYAAASTELAFNTRQQLFESLQFLTPKQRVIVQLKRMGHSEEEIALHLHITPDRVKHEWAKARKIVQRRAGALKFKQKESGEATGL